MLYFRKAGGSRISNITFWPSSLQVFVLLRNLFLHWWTADKLGRSCDFRNNLSSSSKVSSLSVIITKYLFSFSEKFCSLCQNSLQNIRVVCVADIAMQIIWVPVSVHLKILMISELVGRSFCIRQFVFVKTKVLPPHREWSTGQIPRMWGCLNFFPEKISWSYGDFNFKFSEVNFYEISFFYNKDFHLNYDGGSCSFPVKELKISLICTDLRMHACMFAHTAKENPPISIRSKACHALTSEGGHHVPTKLFKEDNLVKKSHFKVQGVFNSEPRLLHKKWSNTAIKAKQSRLRLKRHAGEVLLKDNTNDHLIR